MYGPLGARSKSKSYFSTLKHCNVEAVFNLKDLLPGLAEVLLVPYLAIKRGF